MLYGIYFKGMCSFDVQDHLKKKNYSYESNSKYY